MIARIYTIFARIVAYDPILVSARLRYSWWFLSLQSFIFRNDGERGKCCSYTCDNEQIQTMHRHVSDVSLILYS